MKIGLNLLSVMPEIGGGWNYIAELINAIAIYDKKNDYVFFVTSKSDSLVPNQVNFKKIIINLEPSSRINRIAYENTILQFIIKKHKIDLVHWFCNYHAILNSTPTIVSVFDMQPFITINKFKWIKKAYLQMMMRQTVKKAEMLLPMSKATATSLNEILKVPLSRMVVIPPIINSEFKPQSLDNIKLLVKNYNLPSTFWLYVAHCHPHKNHMGLLTAYYELKNSGFNLWPLVLRGDGLQQSDSIQACLQQLDLTNDIHFLPRLEIAEMATLYSTATALIFPSLYEGGGIPIIEAMACGCPVVASDLPPILEFAGDIPLYFNPRDRASIVNSMKNIQESGDLKAFKDAGIRQVEKFSSKSIVDILLKSYEFVISK